MGMILYITGFSFPIIWCLYQCVECQKAAMSHTSLLIPLHKMVTLILNNSSEGKSKNHKITLPQLMHKSEVYTTD